MIKTRLKQINLHYSPWYSYFFYRQDFFFRNFQKKSNIAGCLSVKLYIEGGESNGYWAEV